MISTVPSRVYVPLRVRMGDAQQDGLLPIVPLREERPADLLS